MSDVEYTDTVRFVRMKHSNDDILTELVEVQAHNPDINIHYWQFINPLKIVYMNNPLTGGLAIGLMPWVSTMFTPEQTFNVKDEDILLMSNVAVEIASSYYRTLEESKLPPSDETMEFMEQIEEEFEDAPIDKKHYH